MSAAGSLVLLFALSGFSGLIYESIWTQYIKLFLGHAAYAQALVLSIYMGGMALGSWICMRSAPRWKNLLAIYALAEGALGLAALVFHESFNQTMHWCFGVVIPRLGSPVAATIFAWTLSTLMIFPQTVLLGMTFPLMAAGLRRRMPPDSGGSIALLYFANSFGAALGVLTSGFFLVNRLGLPGTIRCAGLITIGVAVCVLLVSRRLPRESPQPAPVPHEVAARRIRWPSLLLAVALVTGASSFMYEMGWIRMLTQVLGSATHSFELMLGAFIFGLAGGSLWVRRRIGLKADPVPLLAVTQVVMGLCALATLLLYGHTFDVMSWLMKTIDRTPGGYVSFTLLSGLIPLALMLPATVCAGMTLPLITQALIARGHGERSIGAVYAANTVGAIAGIGFSLLVGLPLLGLKGLIVTGASLDVAAGAALLWLPTAAGAPRWPRIALAAAGVGCLVAAGLFVRVDPYKMGSGVYRFGELLRSETAKLLYYKDGRTASVSAFSGGSIVSIRTNGKPDAGLQLDPWGFRTQDESTMILLGAIGLALHPQARTAANVGFGSGLTTATLLQSDTIAAVHTVEIEPAIVAAARHAGPLVQPAFTDARSRIHFEDAKTFFSVRNQRYDIILSEPSNPWVSGVAGLFSEEFYRMISGRLSEGGVFCQWLQLYEIDEDLVASVLKALAAVFPDYVVYAANDWDIVIVATNGTAVPDPDPLVLAQPKLATSLRRIQIENLDDLLLRRISSRKLIGGFAAAHPVPANSDFRPFLDQNAVRARFLRTDARELFSLGHTPLPLAEMLAFPVTDSNRPTTATPVPDFIRANAAAAAVALRDGILGRAPDPPPAHPDFEASAAELKGLFASDCGAGPDVRIDRIYGTVALGMVPFLRPTELEDVWRILEQGACFPGLTARERRWVDFVRATGRRDAAAMATIARVLLQTEQGLREAPTRYLLAAGLLGSVAQGRQEEASALWLSQRERLFGTAQPPVLFRFLAAPGAGPWPERHP